MLKRFIAFFVSICLVFVFVCSSFVSFAVAPIALVEAALVSYVASTGYKLWVDNGTGSDVLSLMSDLYSDWLFSLSGGTLTLEQIGQQNLVYNDTSGHICITKTAADIFQDFSDWLQTNYSIQTDDTAVTVVSGQSGIVYPTGSGSVSVTSYMPAGDFYNNAFLSDLGYTVTDNTNTLQSFISSHNSSGIIIEATSVAVSNSGGAFSIFAFPVPNVYNIGSSISGAILSYRGDVVVSGTNKAITLKSVYLDSVNSSRTANYGKSVLYGYKDVICNINVSSASAPGLALSLAQNVIDKAGDVAQDYVLVFDVGASVGATATDIADAVVAGYDTATGVVPVTDTITAADVIDTPVQPYPDVDSLGLPQLGLALTTRFPFSIPWDISAIYSAISAPSEPPVKTFDLIPASVLARWGINANTSITIDLTDQKYDVLLAIIHWSCIIGFCFGLAVMTKRYVWTTGG